MSEFSGRVMAMLDHYIELFGNMFQTPSAQELRAWYDTASMTADQRHRFYVATLASYLIVRN